MNEVYIVSIARTPIGSFGGSLTGFSATQLGSIAIKSAVERAGINPESVQDVFMGNVNSANLGQAPAKQAALGAGLSVHTNCTTINKVCSSGMKSIIFAAQAIQLGLSDVVVAGGMESMSNIPYYLSQARWGYKFGGGEIIDGLQKDGLMDAYDHIPMGVCGDETAQKYQISREAQDAFTIQSYSRAAEATLNGKFKNEIVPISVPQKKGDPLVFTEDEEYKKVDFAKIPGLKPIFSKDGTVTAANASTLNDGASALVLMSAKKIKELNIKPIARIVNYADAEQAPRLFTTSPALAANLCIEGSGINKNDIDFFEINEAFAVVPIVVAQLLEVDLAKFNVNGGAVSIGHPLGSSGSRIVCTLSQVLEQNQAKYGLAAICNGGGGASAIIIERI
ncbi:MAG: acetyl-CoA C-acyltransferase [Saprospiraceae bacterium]|nr:acetyl-CoA C-acyltransferase [Candidatus Defluviibacterium haderslevense]